MRSRWLWLVGAAGLFVPVFPEPPLATGPYLQDVTEDGAVVALIDAAPTARRLEVRPAGADPATPAVATLSSPASRRHAFRVSGLAPGAAYDYRVTDAAGGGGRGGTFATAPASPDAEVRFVVFGDSGGLPPWVWAVRMPLVHGLAVAGLLPHKRVMRDLCARMVAERPHLALHTGDVVYPAGEHRHYAPGFFTPFAELLAMAPVYAVLGNHDYEHDAGRPFLQNFHLPRGSGADDEQFFTWTWGPIRFIGLNLNHAVGVQPAVAYLRAVLPAAREPWKVVLQHFPIRSGSRQGDRGDLEREVLPLLLEHGVDFLFTGHDHVYQRFHAERGLHLIVTGGGGKSLYELTDHPRRAAAAREYHFCAVRILGGRAELRAIAHDGRELDRVAVEKPVR
jgi:predicted phosphodiesterase